MDEEYSESIDTSTDMDVLDVDVADDISTDIPDDVPEDNYSDTDILDDISEDITNETVDANDYDEIDDFIEEDAIDFEDEKIDEFIDDFAEDTYEDSDALFESDRDFDDILEDIDGTEADLDDEATDVEDIPEDTENDIAVVQDEFFEEDIPEDVVDNESTEEVSDIEDANATESLDENHPMRSVHGSSSCGYDTRDDQENYPSLKSLENKEYFDDARALYNKAEDVAGESNLKYYKAHDMEHHIDKVIERSTEASDIIEKVTDVQCDKKDLAVAALYHDTGMDGGGKYEASDGNGIRINHPMTSAIHVLNNREALENDGCNVDQVAALSLLHSKSCSGVKNLADNEQIEVAFSKLQAEVSDYNVINPDNPVSFNKDAIDIEKFKYNAASLRLGDAYGHDSSSTKTQSGDFYDIDYGDNDVLTHEEWGENYWKDEISNSNLIFHENGDAYNIDDTNDAEGYTRMYQFGEGNIAAMHSRLGEIGEFQSVIDVNSGMAKPLCTQECILERLKELKTADELFSHSTIINLYGDCDDKHLALYESFARENEAEYGRIKINHVGGKYNGET